MQLTRIHSTHSQLSLLPPSVILLLLALLTHAATRMHFNVCVCVCAILLILAVTVYPSLYDGYESTT